MGSLDRNELYPVFLKLDKLKVLVIGGGNVGEEKLHFLLKSSPKANVSVITIEAKAEVRYMSDRFNFPIIFKKADKEDMLGYDVIIAATNDHHANLDIHQWAKDAGKIINVADTPSLCDFYMGSIVTKGNLKIGISTNGKSPTIAKRMRQYLEENIPEEIDELIHKLKGIRDNLDGDFALKVRELNKLTSTLVE